MALAEAGLSFGFGGQGLAEHGGEAGGDGVGRDFFGEEAVGGAGELARPGGVFVEGGEGGGEMVRRGDGGPPMKAMSGRWARLLNGVGMTDRGMTWVRMGGVAQIGGLRRRMGEDVVGHVHRPKFGGTAPVAVMVTGVVRVMPDSSVVEMVSDIRA